jgi:hypothetical protein
MLKDEVMQAPEKAIALFVSARGGNRRCLCPAVSGQWKVPKHDLDVVTFAGENLRSQNGREARAERALKIREDRKGHSRCGRPQSRKIAPVQAPEESSKALPFRLKGVDTRIEQFTTEKSPIRRQIQLEFERRRLIPQHKLKLPMAIRIDDEYTAQRYCWSSSGLVLLLQVLLQSGAV